jgi:hypothetical protein
VLHQLHEDRALRNQKFGLPEWNYVPAGDTNKKDKFHREDLLIYMLIKIKDGVAHTTMADNISGGNPHRWSYGYKYIVSHLDHRYYHNIIGPNGFYHWVSRLPEFAKSIPAQLGETPDLFTAPSLDLRCTVCRP